jgi:hypothetical protein
LYLFRLGRRPRILGIYHSDLDKNSSLPFPSLPFRLEDKKTVRDDEQGICCLWGIYLVSGVSKGKRRREGSGREGGLERRICKRREASVHSK